MGDSADPVASGTELGDSSASAERPTIGEERLPGARPIDVVDGASALRGVIRDEAGTELWACDHGHLTFLSAQGCARRAMREAGWQAPELGPAPDQPSLGV